MSLPHWMEDSPDANVLAALHALCWADGDLDASETTFISHLVDSMGLEPSAEELSAWLSTAPDEGAADRVTEEFEQHALLFEAMLLAHSDGHFGKSERAMVTQWATKWGIPQDELDKMLGEVKAQKASADLLSHTDY
jgi:uncharacterized membrane protein YebE (DUF533 family)